MLKGFCEIIHVSLNAVIIVTYFVQSRHSVYVIFIFTGKCAILILQKLWFGVCHRCCCLLIYDDSVILSCFILICHRTFLFSKIFNLFIYGIFSIMFCIRQSNPKPSIFRSNNKYSNQVYVIKPSDY